MLSAGAVVYDDGFVGVSWVERSEKGTWTTHHMAALNGNGDLLFHREYDLAKRYFSPFMSLIVDSGHNFYCTLSNPGNAGVSSYDTIRLDSSGDFVWSISTPPIGEIRHIGAVNTMLTPS